MRGPIDPDAAWAEARIEAEARLLVHGRRPPRRMPAACPLGFDDLTAAEVDWDATVRRIAEA